MKAPSPTFERNERRAGRQALFGLTVANRHENPGFKSDPDFSKRKKIKALLDRLIPEFSVRLGGATSVDVTKPGIDKAYGIRKLRDTLGIAIQEMIYIGDALFPGGNDYPAEEAGAVSIPVRDPQETKRVIEAIVACLDSTEPAQPRKEESR